MRGLRNSGVSLPGRSEGARRRIQDSVQNSVQDRVQQWVQPVAEHQVQAVDVDTRVGLSRSSMRGVVAVALAISVVIGVWLGLRWTRVEDPQPLPDALSAPVVPPSSSNAVPEPARSEAPLVVSVQGMVARPGLLRVPEGTRVGEAIDQAGGVLPGADLRGLNLAMRLEDGMQVLVVPESEALPGEGDGPQHGSHNVPQDGWGAGPEDGGASRILGADGATAAGSTGGAASDGGLVNINTASAQELQTLNGVGPSTAEAIVTWREANGPFATVEQLQEVRGIGPAKFAALRDKVRV